MHDTENRTNWKNVENYLALNLFFNLNVIVNVSVGSMSGVVGDEFLIRDSHN
uniref:Uncharacterized protein n=1 Tax=Rhizophagus irregularis (strain DAOM 181602 / DAOM 197198 / MUCL 43194) TaxID=747089 RepID=U9UDA0_RHIID